MSKIGYLALSLYLLLVALTATIPNLLVPSLLMSGLAFIASLGIFIDWWYSASSIQKLSQGRQSNKNL